MSAAPPPPTSRIPQPLRSFLTSVFPLKRGKVSAEVCEEVTNFFNNLVIDLDGAQLRLGSLTSAVSPMRFDGEGEPGCVELEMRIDVVKFPNPITTSF
jgi:hypothetical protein